MVHRYSQGPQPHPAAHLSVSFLYTFPIRVQQNKPSYVRFYRDYSIADFYFCAFTLILITYAAFLGPARARVCEDFSHQSELMRFMLEIGLNLENCDRCLLERVVFAVLTVLFFIMVVRVSPSSYYNTIYTMVFKFFPIQSQFPSCSILTSQGVINLDQHHPHH